MSYQVPYHVCEGEKEEGSYIIKLKDESDKQSILDWIRQEYSGSEGVDITHECNRSNHFNAFSAKLPEDVLNVLRNHDAVEYIADDAIMYANSTTTQPSEIPGVDDAARISKEAIMRDSNDAALGDSAVASEGSAALAGSITQLNATWGLHRVSHRGLARAPYNYVYPGSGGEGVIAYILDTGIYIQHSDFEGRASHGRTYYSTNDDRVGHGTHVAATVIGRNYGVAKKATAIAVKVLSDTGSGSTSNIIAGIDWVVSQFITHRRPSIINMSLGGPTNIPLDDAVNSAVTRGVLTVVAAGNDGADAANTSPARAINAFTVGNITIQDTRARSSNFGRVVDIYAPGSDILSAGTSGPDATATLTGTSMASPHVAGLFALYISENRPDIAPGDLRSLLTRNSDATREGLRIAQVPGLMPFSGANEGDD